MKQIKYPSIENTCNSKHITKIKKHGFDDPKIKYGVSVKCDGCNFCIAYSTQEDKIKYFSRNQEVTGTNFHNYEEVVRNFDLEKKIKLLSEKLKKYNEIYFEIAKCE